MSEEKKITIESKVEELGLSVRASRCFLNLEIDTVGELCALKHQDFLRMKGFGRKSLIELKAKLASHGFSLSDDYFFKQSGLNYKTVENLVEIIHERDKTIERLKKDIRALADKWSII